MQAPYPWIPFSAIEWLGDVLTPASSVFEYGAGNSSRFFAQRVGTLISVEHHVDWHKAVVKMLHEGGRSNAQCLLEEPELSLSPGDYGSENPRYAGMTFERYVKTLERVTPSKFDLILIDGRARAACTKLALKHIKPGGWIVLDNSHRPRYRTVVEEMSGYPTRRFYGCTPYQTTCSTTTAWKIQ